MDIISTFMINQYLGIGGNPAVSEQVIIDYWVLTGDLGDFPGTIIYHPGAGPAVSQSCESWIVKGVDL